MLTCFFLVNRFGQEKTFIVFSLLPSQDSFSAQGSDLKTMENMLKTKLCPFL